MRESTKRGGYRPHAGRKAGEPSKVVRLPLPIAAHALGLAGARFRASDINEFLDVEVRTTASVPLMQSRAECGFPSPADDYLDQPLDFNELLIENPAATFAVRIAGESMIGAGIFPGDIGVVNRARPPLPGCIVLALVDGAFTIKRYLRRSGVVVLHPENPAFKDMVIGEGMSFEVWGVVTNVIRVL